MRIEFANNKLRRCYERETLAIKEWGPVRGPRYRRVVDRIKAANTFDDLFSIPSLRTHPLRGNRQGQHALTVQGTLRLIVVRGEDDRSVTLREVVDYHG